MGESDMYIYIYIYLFIYILMIYMTYSNVFIYKEMQMVMLECQSDTWASYEI